MVEGSQDHNNQAMEAKPAAAPETVAQPSESKRENRRRPPKSNTKNSRVQGTEGVNTATPQQPEVPKAAVDAGSGSITAFVPRSVARHGKSKLNPTAVEFKPSSEESPAVAQPAIQQANPRGRQRKATNHGSHGSQVLPAQDAHVESAPPKQQGGSRAPQEKYPAHARRATRSGEKQPGEQPVPESVVSDHESAELSCPICTDVATYFAVGKCNHHVCSLCAVRIRVKSKDKHCVICKEDLAVMIIYRPHYPKGTDAKNPPVSGDNVLLRPFNSFGLTEADCDLDGGNIPGVRVDPSAGLLFVDCAQHFTEIENLRAMTCPFKHCKARFPTIQTLQRHLKDNHKDVALCTLCVENRPLFISEHTVMNPRQLMCHMKGELYVDPSGKKIQPSENEHTSGHPACEFCTERFFDNTALYYHMQRSYFTCHLCPRQHMFRYYIDPAALREHHRREHIVCHICAAVPQLMDSDVAIAFRDAREYSDHMRHIHNTQVSGIAGINNGSSNKTSFRLGASSTYQTNTSTGRRDKNGRPLVTVVDLEMGSANPFRNETEASNQRGSQATSRPVDHAAPLIPPHMRIAGRVTGAGRFAEMDSGDMLMQAAAEEYALQAEREARGQKKSLRLSKEQAFPTLSAAYGAAPVVPVHSSWKSKVSSHASLSESETEGTSSATDSAKRGVSPAAPTASNELHPMSLLHSNKQQAKDLQRRKDAEDAEKARLEKQRQEDKRIERNLSLASALLGGAAKSADNGASSHLSLTAADVGATLKNRSFINSLIAPLQQLGWTEAELMRTIYPPVLVNWAKLHMLELSKIEKKLYTLLNDPQLNSVQLKPMARGMRTVVHQLSRMYLLNSYEFDAEPNRYVSLVKQVDSYLPSCVLSRAAALPLYTLPGENGTEVPDMPVIFLTLSSEAYSAGLVNTNSSVSSAGKKAPGSLAAGPAEPVRIAFTTAEIVSRVNDLLNSADLWRSWYKHVIDTADLELLNAQLADAQEQVAGALPLPPPPPGIPPTGSPPAAPINKSSKPRALSDLPVPRITGLVAAGASSVGLRFGDRVSAQLAALYMEYCVALHFVGNTSNSKMGARVQGSTTKFDLPMLSAKQVQELTVLSVFHFTPAFHVCTVADIVFNTNVPLASAGRPVEGTEMKSAALDRRHYMKAEESWTTVNKASTKAAPAATTSKGSDGYSAKKLPSGEDGWQMQALKTKLYDDSASSLLAVPLHDSWEELEQFPDFNQNAPALVAEQPQKREEWDSFLQDKRAKAEASGAVPRYQPKRSESTKYVPPSARAKAAAGEKSDVSGAADDNRKVSADGIDTDVAVAEAEIDEDAVVGEALDDGYDLCEGDYSGAENHDSGAAHQQGEVFATDYLESEADFEEYLRRLQLEHDREQAQGKGPGTKARAPLGEVRAVPFNALLSRADANTSTVHAVAAVAVPISDDLSEEESARVVLKKQLQREQSASKYNKFGVLDEDDADA